MIKGTVIFISTDQMIHFSAATADLIKLVVVT